MKFLRIILFLLIVTGGASAGCGGAGSEPAFPPVAQAPAPTETAPSEIPAGRFGPEVPEDVRGYLEAVHKLLHPRWAIEVVERAARLLPPEAPANQPGLKVEVELALSRRGEPTSVRVVTSSGLAPFDESAVAAMTSLSALPPLPKSLGEGHVFLRWDLRRDDGPCDPGRARLEVLPLSPAETLTLALEQGDFPRAASLLRAAGSEAGPLFAPLVEAVLLSTEPDLHRTVLPLCQSERLAKLSREHPDTLLKQEALRELARRGEKALLTGLLDGEPRVSPSKSVPTHALLEALVQVGAIVPGSALGRFLDDQDLPVQLAAAALLTQTVELEPLLAASPPGSAREAVLLVRRAALLPVGQADLAALRKLLSGPQRSVVLQALGRFPVAALASDLASIGRHEPDATMRLAALRALTVAPGSTPLPALYTALKAPDERVRAGAARLVGELGRNPAGSSFRLAELAIAERGSDAVAALAALARLGQGRFLADLGRLMRRFRPSQQAQIVGELWGFGMPAMPLLTRLAASGPSEVAEAARASIARIEGKGSLDGSYTIPEMPTSLKELVRLALTLGPSR